MTTKDVVALGAAYTGKTFSLERACAEDEEFEDYEPTYYEKASQVVTVNSKPVHVVCHEVGGTYAMSDDGSKDLSGYLKKSKGVLLYFDKSNFNSVKVLKEIVEKNKKEIKEKPVVLVANMTRETSEVSNVHVQKLGKSLSHALGTQISTVEIPYIDPNASRPEDYSQLKIIFHEIGKRLTGFRVQPAEFKVDGGEAFSPLELLPLHTRPKHKPRGIPRISDPIAQQRSFKENSERERERYGYEKLLKRIEELEKSLERERQERKRCFSLLGDKIAFIFKSFGLKFRKHS